MKINGFSDAVKNKPNQTQFYPPQADSNVPLQKWVIARNFFAINHLRILGGPENPHLL